MLKDERDRGTAQTAGRSQGPCEAFISRYLSSRNSFLSSEGHMTEPEGHANEQSSPKA